MSFFFPSGVLGTCAVLLTLTSEWLIFLDRAYAQCQNHQYFSTWLCFFLTEQQILGLFYLIFHATLLISQKGILIAMHLLTGVAELEILWLKSFNSAIFQKFAGFMCNRLRIIFSSITRIFGKIFLF